MENKISYSRQMRYIEYTYRDTTGEPESGSAVGLWGPLDWTGKRPFVIDGPVPTIYLFFDEVTKDEQI